jgi:hypothetical protein
MDTRLKAKLETAIERVINDNCEDDYWRHYIHTELYRQMTNAAELVFDSAQDAQEFKAREDS